MKRLNFLCFLVCLGFNYGFAQLQADSLIYIGSKRQLYSHVLNEHREVYIHLPKDYFSEKYPLQRYPVIYLLDAEQNFAHFSAMIDYLSKGPYAYIPQMIIVGITNTERTRDLTPTKLNSGQFRSPVFENSGGNELFLSYLMKELHPFIEKNYRSNGYRIFVGHSFGGLTVINALLNHQDFFNAYVALDPSLWWDNEVMKKQAMLLYENDFDGKVLFLAAANKIKIAQDTTTDMKRAIDAFVDLTKSRQPRGLRFAYRFYATEDHGTVHFPAEFDALKFVFDGYLIQVKAAVQAPEIVEKTFADLSDKLKFKFLPQQSYLDWMENYCLEVGKKESAEWFSRFSARIGVNAIPRQACP